MLKVYDEEMVFIKEMSRKDAHATANNWHQTVHMIIYNRSDDTVTLQKRDSSKKLYPDMLISTVSGHVDDDESAIEALSKESSEEIGLSIGENTSYDFLGICKYYNYLPDGIFDYEFINVFILIVEQKPNLKPNEEVSEIIELKLEDFRNLVIAHSDELVPVWPVYHMIIEWLHLKNSLK